PGRRWGAARGSRSPGAGARRDRRPRRSRWRDSRGRSPPAPASSPAWRPARTATSSRSGAAAAGPEDPSAPRTTRRRPSPRRARTVARRRLRPGARAPRGAATRRRGLPTWTQCGPGPGLRQAPVAARCALRHIARMRILVSNDDGVEAPGMRALAEGLLELGEVVVCAPDREQSATSRSISLHRPLRIEQLPPWGPDGQIERWSVDGTPTDAVYIGLNQVLKGRPPELVASGINRGPNLANDVHYSGTVAAAMEGSV